MSGLTTSRIFFFEHSPFTPTKWVDNQPTCPRVENSHRKYRLTQPLPSGAYVGHGGQEGHALEGSLSKKRRFGLGGDEAPPKMCQIRGTPAMRVHIT